MTLRQKKTAHARRLSAIVAALAGVSLVLVGALPASAVSYTRISGEGSSWAGNALSQWVSDVHNQGVTVDFNPNGSSLGRKDFATNLNADFAISEIPYTGDTADPQDATKPNFNYAMLPVVSGGTSFMYNLKVGGNRLTTLKISQAALAGIFTGQITQWNDPAIAADNPGVSLPAQRITVVVRSEGSGATAQFTLWLLRQFPQLYAKLCAVTGCDPHHATSYFPHDHLSNFVAQNGSTGVTTYTANTAYTINYDEYSYALGAGFPVAKVKNAAGFYTVPDQYAVAVAMLQAKINLNKGTPDYLSQDLSNVYEYKDPRTYPLSMYTYELVPTQAHGSFTTAKGATLGYFDQYALCEGQRTMGAQGYSPLPMNLVLAALDQVKLVPGVDAPTLSKINATGKAVSAGTGNPCNNPTFKPGESPSHNVLVDTAPFPVGCNAACKAPWANVSANNGGPDEGGGAAGGGGAAANGGGTGDGTDGTGGTGDDATNQDGGKQVCDADTGVCTSSDSSLAAGSNVKAIPAVITEQLGWAGPQTLMVVIGLLVLAGLIAPAIVGRVLTRGGPGSKGRR